MLTFEKVTDKFYLLSNNGRFAFIICSEFYLAYIAVFIFKYKWVPVLRLEIYFCIIIDCYCFGLFFKIERK
jgi:hypothetical protein